MPKCYLYARASSNEQVSDGDSIPHQNRRTLEYYEREIKPRGVEFGLCVEDPGVSAYKKPFDRRPGGKQLITMMEPGDHIVIDKVDRVWRSLSDFVRLLEYFKRRMISFHFVNLQGMAVSSDSAMGEFMLGMLVMVAQLESAIKSERNTVAAIERRKEGRPIGQTPFGMKIVTKQTQHGPRKFLEWDEIQMGVMYRIASLREAGKSNGEIADILQRQFADLTGKAFRKSFVCKREWTDRQVRDIYRRFIRYRDSGVLEMDAAAASEKISNMQMERKKAKLLARAKRSLS